MRLRALESVGRSMASFGEKIRRERQRREITLFDVSRATKISLRYLNALERNDFRELPGGVFNRGYVRAYARFVGADPETMVRAYLAEEEARGVGDTIEDLELLKSLRAAAVQGRARRGGSPRNRRRTRILSVAWLLPVVVLVPAGWYYLEHAPREGDWTHTTVAVLSAVLDALQDPSDGEPPVVEPAAGPVKPPAHDVVMAAEPRRPAPAGVGDNKVPVAPREVAPTSLDEKDLHERVQEAPIAADAPSDLSVAHFGVGTAVVDHELRGRSDRFEEGTEVWFWTRVIGGHAGELVRHVWYHESHQVGVAILPLGGPHWRTQSRRSLDPGSAGRWSVEVRDARGRLLVREQFVCVPAESMAARWQRRAGFPRVPLEVR